MTLLSYPGGKGRLAARIAALMEPHRVYVEPFGGTAAVLLAKAPAPFEIVNDLDRRLVNLLRVVRDRPAELAAALELTPYARAEYDSADVDVDVDDLERARRTAVRIGQSFSKSGLVRPTQGWSIATTCQKADAATWAMLPERVLLAAARLRGVAIECRPALELIGRYGADPGAVLYVDPPYVGTGRRVGLYTHELASDDEHRELAAALGACRAQVLLSGYHGELYDELYGEWPQVTFRASANHNGQTGAAIGRTEVVWSNRALVREQLALAVG